MKLTNGKKIIERKEEDYQKNINIWNLRGWKPVNDNVKKVEETFENETKVVPIKSKKKKDEKEMNNIKKYIKLAKRNPRISLSVAVIVIIILSWVF